MRRAGRLLILYGWMCGSALAGSRDLRADLKGLNVRLKTEHYALAGTVTDGRLADFGAALEFIHAEYAAGFSELLAEGGDGARREGKADVKGGAARGEEGNSGSERFSVVVLAKESEYREFTTAYFDRRVEHTRGLFVPAVELLVVLDIGDAGQTYATLFHEAFHQFLHRHVPQAPMWVNEGLATYYETARPTGGGLAFDRPRDDFFQVVKSAADAKKLIPFDVLMTADVRAFYDVEEMPGLSVPRSAVYYAQSYTLCAFILSDGEGRLLMRRYLQALAGAGSAEEAARITVETFPELLRDAMVTPWLRYVNKY